MSSFTGAILASLIANALSSLAKQLLPQSTAQTRRGRLVSKLLQNHAPLSDILSTCDGCGRQELVHRELGKARSLGSPFSRIAAKSNFFSTPWPSGQYGKSSPRYSRRGTVVRWILELLDYKNFGKRGHPLFRGTADSAPASSLR
jgi:hypothetical protein